MSKALRNKICLLKVIWSLCRKNGAAAVVSAAAAAIAAAAAAVAVSAAMAAVTAIGAAAMTLKCTRAGLTQFLLLGNGQLLASGTPVEIISGSVNCHLHSLSLMYQFVGSDEGGEIGERINSPLSSDWECGE